jgi:MFS transporter, DHA2 family, multidrug resistance protein
LRTDGTAMLTLIRNIFSSIGISIMVAQLTSGTTVMHARLTEYLTPFSGPLQMPDATAIFSMTSDAGRALLDAIVTQQAVIIAYGNDYKMLMVLSVVAMPLVLLVGTSAAVRRLARPETHAMD